MKIRPKGQAFAPLTTFTLRIEVSALTSDLIPFS
jgi:hypothetical protein